MSKDCSDKCPIYGKKRPIKDMQLRVIRIEPDCDNYDNGKCLYTAVKEFHCDNSEVDDG